MGVNGFKFRGFLFGFGTEYEAVGELPYYPI
jgi:hypothetical protein